MRLSTRYSQIGIAALSIHSLVHWRRRQHYESLEVGVYQLGILPTFLAAIAVPFLFISLWVEQNANRNEENISHAGPILASISGVGLVC